MYLLPIIDLLAPLRVSHQGQIKKGNSVVVTIKVLGAVHRTSLSGRDKIRDDFDVLK